VRAKVRNSAVLLMMIGSGLVLMLTSPVGAQEVPTIVIPISTVVRDDPGTVHVLATQAVPAEWQGTACTVSSTSENQSSVHPGSNLTITSGSDSVVLLDVEAVPGGTVTASGTLTLDADIVVSLQLGPDGVFSAGLIVTITCPAEPSPSPSPSPSPTTSPSPSPSPSPTDSPTPSPSPTSPTPPSPEGPTPSPEPDVEVEVEVETGGAPGGQAQDGAGGPGQLAFTGPSPVLPVLASVAVLSFLTGLALLWAGRYRGLHRAS
jgi:hypothetical protein